MNEALVVWLKSTWISHAMTTSQWAWPIAETFHFIGLALLIGGAGLIDLRLMGFLKSVSVSGVMQVRKWAALGIAVNVITGVLFFVGAPDQYIDNPAWYGKLLFLAVAIVNVGLRDEITSCNPAFERLFGWTEAEARGRNLDELVAPPDKLAEARANSQEAFAGRLAEGPAVTLEALSLRDELDSPLGRVVTYASIGWAVDTTDQGAVGRYGRATTLRRPARRG